MEEFLECTIFVLLVVRAFSYRDLTEKFCRAKQLCFERLGSVGNVGCESYR